MAESAHPSYPHPSSHPGALEAGGDDANGAETTPPITLRIAFTGLFTFVPSNDGRHLIVLVPRTGVLGNKNGVHQHHCLLIVNRDYVGDKPIQPGPDPNCVREHAGGAKHDRAGHENDAHGGSTPPSYEVIPLGRYRVEFKGLTQGDYVQPPTSAADLTLHAGLLRKEQVTEAPFDSVWAQIVLPAATTTLESGEKAEWRFGSGKPKLSHQVFWATEVDAGNVTIKFKHLGGGQAGDLVLKPGSGGPTIDLLIENLPVEHDRHKGKKCHDAPHFLAYYELFGMTAGPIPVLNQEPLLALRAGEPDGPRVDDKFTCMTSQARTGT